MDTDNWDKDILSIRQQLDLKELVQGGNVHFIKPFYKTSIFTDKQMRSLQKQNFVAALKQSNWRVSGKGGAAEILGIKPTTLTDRIKSFGIRKPGS